MKKWLRIFVLAGAVALVVTLLVLALRPREPAYEGRRLSEWLQGFSLMQAHDTEEPVSEAQITADAVRHIGAPCLPTLLKLITARDSAPKRKLMELAEKQGVVRLHFVPAEDLRHRAVEALGALGATAEPAVPALSALLCEPEVGLDAATALGRMGGAGAVALRAALTNRNSQVLEHVLPALRQYSSDLETALPALLACARHDAPVVRQQAALALTQAVARHKADAAVVLPTLRFLVQDRNADVRYAALVGLRDSHSDPKADFDSLLKAAADDNANVRCAALSALCKAAPLEAALAVPRLIERLNDPIPVVRQHAVAALRAYGDKARPAVPMLLKLLERADPPEQRTLSAALLEIDREAAGRAGIKPETTAVP